MKQVLRIYFIQSIHFDCIIPSTESFINIASLFDDLPKSIKHAKMSLLYDHQQLYAMCFSLVCKDSFTHTNTYEHTHTC